MKKIPWILAIGIIGLGSTVYYYWTEATTTPDWYKEATAESETASSSPTVTSTTAPLVNSTSSAMPQASNSTSSAAAGDKHCLPQSDNNCTDTQRRPRFDEFPNNQPQTNDQALTRR
jgi:hypothetical protein